MLADPEVRALILETFGSLDIAINSAISTETPPELTAALRNNAFIFSGFKTYHSLSEVGLALTDPDGKVKSFEQFSRDVHAIDSKYNVNYLRAEYNHAVRSSQMAVRWNDAVRDGDRYLLQYRTAGDGRVREAHAALHNTTLPPSDPFWDSYYPPNGWNCRCTAVQVLRDDYRQSDSAAAIAAGEACTSEPKQRIFRFNPGKQLKLFPPKHPYLPKGCGNCSRRGQINLSRGLGLPQCQACGPILKLCLKEAERRVKEWMKEKIPEHGHIAITGDNFTTGSMLVTRGALKDVMWHTSNVAIIGSLEGIDRTALKYRYLGWMPNKLDNETGEIKHPEAAFFMYYEVELGGKNYYVNVKAHKGLKAEVFYCIYGKCDTSKLKPGIPKPPEQW